MTDNLTGFLYLIAAVLFILALRGLSNPETSRQGNIFGIAGMVIAIATTLAHPGVVSYWMIILGMIIGGCDRHRRRAAHPDDGAAAAGRGLPQSGRYGGGLRRHRRPLSSRSLRHRHRR